VPRCAIAPLGLTTEVSTKFKLRGWKWYLKKLQCGRSLLWRNPSPPEKRNLFYNNPLAPLTRVGANGDSCTERNGSESKEPPRASERTNLRVHWVGENISGQTFKNLRAAPAAGEGRAPKAKTASEAEGSFVRLTNTSPPLQRRNVTYTVIFRVAFSTF